MYISKLVQEAITAKPRKRPPTPKETGPKVEVKKKEQKGALQKPQSFRRPAPYPGATVVLEARPRLRFAGRRHIPKLVSATGIPFLRFKKPQSPFLGRVIRNKLSQRINYFNQLRAMEEQSEVAALEDLWDRVLYQRHGLLAGLMAGEMTWKQGMKYSLKDIATKLKTQEKKSIDTAERMQKIVDGEKELARKEKIQRELESKRRERGSMTSVEERYS